MCKCYNALPSFNLAFLKANLLHCLSLKAIGESVHPLAHSLNGYDVPVLGGEI